jgi:hypothetical protein
VARIDEDRVAANAQLVARMSSWAEFEDRHERVPDEVVARELPELLELAEAFPSDGRRERLLFPPIGGGPARVSAR